MYHKYFFFLSAFQNRLRSSDLSELSNTLLRTSKNADNMNIKAIKSINISENRAFCIDTSRFFYDLSVHLPKLNSITSY